LVLLDTVIGKAENWGGGGGKKKNSISGTRLKKGREATTEGNYGSI